MSYSCECLGVNWEALQPHKIYKKPYYLLQVMQESVSGTASHMHSSERAMKGSYDKIIIIIIPSYIRKSITRLLPLATLLVLHTCNNRRQQACDIFQYSFVLMVILILLFKVIVLMMVWRTIVKCKLVIQFFQVWSQKCFPTHSHYMYYTVKNERSL